MLVKTKKQISLALIVAIFAMGLFVFIASPVFAQVSIGFPTSFIGLGSQDLRITIANIVRIIFGFIGFIFMLLILYAGFTWMTSGGDQKKIQRAKQILVSATIGLVLMVSAYAIAGFLIRSFTGSVSNGGANGPGGTGPGGFGFALGSGALESHYPGRNARDIPRNTNIYVTFKERMDIATICNGANIDTSHVIIKEAKDANNPAVPGLDAACTATDVLEKTFKFDPTALLGTGNGDVTYLVTLTTGIRTFDNEQALFSNYGWRFTVNSTVDTTPPKVTSVYPDIAMTVPRNSLVQINFSEPVDPTGAAGLYAPPGSTFDNIILGTSSSYAAPHIDGSYASTNQYKTTEFVSNELCGANSCGENVYCLPGPGAPAPATLQIYGRVSAAITDMAGNALDQDSTTTGVNEPFTWQFQTSDDLDLTPPLMLTRTPARGTANANLSAPITINFNKILSSSSLQSKNVGLGRTQNPLVGPAYVGPPYPGPVTNEGNYWIEKDDSQNLDGDGANTPETQVLIYHDNFLPLKAYHPGVNSNVRDVSQNCYFPAWCDNNNDDIGSLAECN